MDKLVFLLAGYLATKIVAPRLFVIDVAYIALVAYITYGVSPVSAILSLPFFLGVAMVGRGRFVSEAGTASALAITGIYLMAQEAAYLKALGFAVATISPAVLLPTLGDRGSLEGLLRYLVISTAANAFMVIGLATRPVYTDFGNFFITLALAVELGTVPMFMWLVDVYTRSSPAGLVALASLPKLAVGFALLYIAPQPPAAVMSVVGALSMLVGNLGALTSRDLRKVFAYSTVAHAGFAFFAYPLDPRVAFWLIYVDTMGKMALFYNLDRGSSRWAAVLLTLNQVGIPPILGFWPKLYLLAHTAASLGLLPAAYVLANIVLTAPYYFRVMMSLPDGAAHFPKVTATMLATLGVLAPLWFLYLS
ncbi:MAG: proton-conducting transporter membrane subunit [Pyrobaculum sp.]